MPDEKMTLSFDSAFARRIREEAKNAGMTVSAWVARAVGHETEDEHEAKLEIARRLQEEWEAEHGPITEGELARARELWPED